MTRRDPAYRPKCLTCSRARRADRLMCPRCWGLVPTNIQMTIYRTWQRDSVRQSDEWSAAVAEAEAAVLAQRQGGVS